MTRGIKAPLKTQLLTLCHGFQTKNKPNLGKTNTLRFLFRESVRLVLF